MRFSLRTPLEWLVPVPDIREEVELVLRCKQCSADGVNGCVAPALVVETTSLVEVLEEFAIGFASPEVEITDLEVAPD